MCPVRRTLAGFIIGILLVIPSLLSGATITVCESGCNETFIADALLAATPGDTISVAAGTYYERLSIEKMVTIRGAGIGETIVDAEFAGPVVTVGELASYRTITLERITFRNGLSQLGGGISLISTSVELILNNCELTGNAAVLGSGDFSGRGGAIYSKSYVTSQLNIVSLDDCLIHSNRADDSGGGIFADRTTLVITDSTIDGNSASYGGGVAALHGDRLSVVRTLVASNVADNIGGILAGNDYNEFTDCQFIDNQSLESSGGLALSGDGEIVRCRFTGNTAALVGGALSTGGVGLVRESAFVGNSASTGGAIMAGGEVTVANVTISENSATSGDAGGILSRGATHLAFATIANNESSTGYAVNIRSEGYTTIQATIVSGSNGNNCGGILTSYGSNIDDDGSCELESPDDLIGVSPDLMALSDLGGAKWYHPLAPTSIAIDALPSPCIDIDQLGHNRPFDGNNDGIAACDIGSVEFLGEFEPVLFEDGFETGSTSEWSATIGS